jgi:oligopeptidase A
VELPSQFLENFAWEPATLKAASAHEESGEPLSDAMIGRMLGARKFLGAMGLVRQAEFALFDLRLHRAAGGDNAPDYRDVLAQVRREVAVIDYPEWHRFPTSFSHIFAGGYAAGYYSYLWAERLSADAYAAFEEGNATRADLGERFRAEVSRAAERALRLKTSPPSAGVSRRMSRCWKAGDRGLRHEPAAASLRPCRLCA